MTACAFCIDSIVQGYCEYQSIWDIPLVDGDLPCEWKTGNSHDSRWLMVPQMQMVGHMAKKYLPINLFDIDYSHEILP